MKKFDVICGLCVLESEDLAMSVAADLKSKFAGYAEEINFYFKGSFDKANRSSINSFRGPGIEKGLAILDRIKSELKVPVLTDYHSPDQADEVASVVDILQIPAFLCRQTDMVIAGARACEKYKCLLNVKKGQFLSPEDTKNIVEKVETFIGKEKLMLTERGTSFGYNNLVVDMSSFSVMKSFGATVIHDATHCVQRPGGLGATTGGKRDQVGVLARAAVAAGADGIFIETHPTPEKALSDASTCLDLSKVEKLISEVLSIYRVCHEFN